VFMNPRDLTESMSELISDSRRSTRSSGEFGGDRPASEN
jgi:hypothetical protein